MKELKRTQENLLLVDSDGTRFGIDSLVVDFESSLRLVMDHFLQEEVKQLVMLAGKEYTKQHRTPVTDPRTAIFQKLISEEKNLTGKIIEADFSVEAGYQAVHDFLLQEKELPDALFAANDALAIGALKRNQRSRIDYSARYLSDWLQRYQCGKVCLTTPLYSQSVHRMDGGVGS